jgi:hypothetical protein
MVQAGFLWQLYALAQLAGLAVTRLWPVSRPHHLLATKVAFTQLGGPVSGYSLLYLLLAAIALRKFSSLLAWKGVGQGATECSHESA